MIGNLKVLGISSGIGVSLFPFKKYCIGNIELRPIFHTPKNEQWLSNFKDIPLVKKLPYAFDESFKPTVIISSPDCGSGSVFRLSRTKTLGDHKKNDSLKLFFDSLKFYKPNFFLFENLDGLFKSFSQEDFEAQCSSYKLIIHNSSVSSWGNSQLTRKRLVIVGIKKDLKKCKKISKYFKLPDYSHKIKTCGELYGDLNLVEIPNMAHIREPFEEIISIHARKRMSLLQIQKEWLTRLKGKKRWTVEGGNFKTAPGVYRNLKDDYPATARKANRQYDHDGITLTPRQLARIQGVPDTFKLYVETSKPNYWINKARAAVTKTPPMEISRWFYKQLKKSKKLWQQV